MTCESPDIARASRRQAGIAALRQLRRLVDEEAARERQQARWVLRLGVGFALALAAYVLSLLGRSGWLG